MSAGPARTTPALACPLCERPDAALLHPKVWSSPDSKVYRCGACDLTFLHPTMSEAQEREFYKDYGKHAIARGVVATNRAEELHEKARAPAKDRLARIARLFEGRGKVLEVGASTGAFLELLEGKERHGVEPADDHRAHLTKFCRKTYADVSEIAAGGDFDVICMFHVFEHIREPRPFLESCTRLLAPEGIVLIEVPCIEDPLLSLYECAPYKDFYFQPMHPYVYSEKSLSAIFEAAGLPPREFVYYQRYGLDNHLTWLSKGRPGTDSSLTGLFGAGPDYKRALEGARKTDTIFCVAAAR